MIALCTYFCKNLLHASEIFYLLHSQITIELDVHNQFAFVTLQTTLFTARTIVYHRHYNGSYEGTNSLAQFDTRPAYGRNSQPLDDS